MNLSITLVDDHVILMDGVEALLTSGENSFSITKVSKGRDLLDQFSEFTSDVLILDINLKDIDGIELLKELRSKGYQGQCLFLSSYDDLKLVNEALKAGAQGYITKNSATDCLENGIRKVMEGEIYYSPDIRERILRAFTSPTDEKSPGSDEQGLLRQLTQRELEVLKLIALQYTSEEIAEQLYIAKSTVDTYRKNLIAKLKVKNSVGLGLFAEKHNLI